jgi:2-dehydro-3-deoxy-D-arabinonate dehydratase
MRLYRTTKGVLLEEDGRAALLPGADWDALLARNDLERRLRSALRKLRLKPFDPARAALLAPLGTQEVWAAGVTYYRSRDARMEESKAAGGGDFYAKVYEADRPEIFFKATPHRVSGPRKPLRIRKDSKWNVPEPELAVVANARGRIVGWTICNDMSSRDIEGENPLYLPQAKVYDQCCGLGPALWISGEPPAPSTPVRIEILRGGVVAFSGATGLDRLKRSPASLLEWLFRDNSFPAGVVLSTGTGVVPPNEFTLLPGDEVRITIDPVGTLVNRIVQG